MPQVVLGIVLILFVFALSRKARYLATHPKVLRSLFFFFGTLVFLILAGVAGYYGWHLWQEKILNGPKTRWDDKTIWIDQSPKTPNSTNKPKRFEIW
ncbi:hypothetical protein A3C52_00290 [Candidatus Peribacteria bacterium RIFCSPHIGHO2_02_FULL_51_15]|nr:MAG: hypothetical protein A3C52_00290 [Candidatus Peribacteria bacterium RIFCSPHIGHO2_02_FULL_51_15]